MADFFNTPNLGIYFHYIVLFLVMWSVIQCARGVVFNEQIVSVNQVLGMFVAIVIIIIIVIVVVVIIIIRTAAA